MKIAAGVMVFAVGLAIVQTMAAPKAGKKLALASIRYSLEDRAQRDRAGVAREAEGTRADLRRAAERDEDETFRDVTLVWLAHEPSRDLRHPTREEDARLPLAEAAEAVKVLTPATGFEGARIRSLYEARGAGKDPHEQAGVLARVVGANPADDTALRAYVAALRGGAPEERKKAVELAEEYVGRDQGSALSRLTLLLALDGSVRRGATATTLVRARELASGLLKDLAPGNVGYDTVRGLAIGPITR